MSASTNLQTSRAARTGEVTRAWVLRRGGDGAAKHAGELEQATLTLPALPDDHVLVETLYGSWEGNMTHALERDPIDICRRLGQDWIVLGNSGVVRVLSVGRDVKGVREGTVCAFAPIGKEDRHGYLETVWAYDEPGTMGLLAERFQIRGALLIPLPERADISAARWAAFPVRYGTAWSNWKVALGAWRLQMPDAAPEKSHVWGWGGGVAYAELQLARATGFNAAMLCTGRERAEIIRSAGILPVDRSEFPELTAGVAPGDRKSLVSYLKAERTFLKRVDEITGGDRVSIFIDNIGGPLARPTLRALGRQGVVTTSGWKCGTTIELNRAIECIERHTLVHTHGCSMQEGLEAMHYALDTGWLPPEPDYIYSWDEIPRLATDYAAGRIVSYFPTFATAAAASL